MWERNQVANSLVIAIPKHERLIGMLEKEACSAVGQKPPSGPPSFVIKMIRADQGTPYFRFTTAASSEVVLLLPPNKLLPRQTSTAFLDDRRHPQLLRRCPRSSSLPREKATQSYTKIGLFAHSELPSFDFFYFKL